MSNLFIPLYWWCIVLNICFSLDWKEGHIKKVVCMSVCVKVKKIWVSRRLKFDQRFSGVRNWMASLVFQNFQIVPSTERRIIWKKIVCVRVKGERLKNVRDLKYKSVFSIDNTVRKTLPEVIEGAESNSEVSFYSLDWEGDYMKQK